MKWNLFLNNIRGGRNGCIVYCIVTSFNAIHYIAASSCPNSHSLNSTFTRRVFLLRITNSIRSAKKFGTDKCSICSQINTVYRMLFLPLSSIHITCGVCLLASSLPWFVLFSIHSFRVWNISVSCYEMKSYCEFHPFSQHLVIP